MAIPPLPPQPVKKKYYNQTWKFKDFIGQDEEFIKLNNTGCLLVDYDSLIGNLHLLNKIISINGVEKINCLDYESALFLENYLEENITLSLVDDYENKDRSYIDMTKFTKNRFYIPLSYFMWDVKFDKTCNIYCFRTVFNDNMSSVNGDEMLSKEIYKNILKKIKEIMGNEKRDNLTDLEKCILVSNYLQRNVQYVAGLESEADKIYVVDAKTEEVTRAKVGSVNSVINENYGLCMAIANTTTLMLNNPVLNVNIRSLKGDSHVWNLVDIDKKLYYIDNTWNITRNKNRVNDALKATSFTDEYLLFGENKAINIGYHNTESYINGDITMEDYSREAIKEKVNILSKNNSFKEYPNKLRFKSKIKN